jgi:hypothetical protein
MIFATILHRRVSEACLVCSLLPAQFISNRLTLRYTLHAPAIGAGQDMKNIVITPLPVRLFLSLEPEPSPTFPGSAISCQVACRWGLSVE